MTDPTAPPDGAPWLPGGFLAMPDGSVAPPAQEAHGSDQGATPGFPFLAQPPPLNPVGTGSYTVDPERAPEAIRELEDAKSKLEILRRDAAELGHVTPPGSDAVSFDAATVLSAVATGSPGSLLTAIEAGIAQLAALIEGARADVADYNRAEIEAGATLDDVDRA